MATPTLKDLLIGFFFIIVGLIKALCDRWQTKLVVQGYPTRKPHTFDHVIFLWFIKQALQLSMFLLWKFIDKNWLGFGRFRHGDVKRRGHENPQGENNEAVPGLVDDDLGNDNAPLLNAEHDGNGHIEVDNIAGLDNEADGNAVDGAPEPEEEPIPPPVGRRNRYKNPSKLIYFPPAFFNVAYILFLHFGLNLTYGSSFIMLKGTVALFTALLAMAFLAQQLACYVWFGVIVATCGFAVSGISDYIHIPTGGYEKYGIAAGDLLIVMAQIMFATQIIYEEKFIRKHSVHPMHFLGCEAMYGFFFATVFFGVFNLVDAVQYSLLPNSKLEDVVDAMYQLQNSGMVTLAVMGSLLSFIVYIYLGLFLIRDQGALPRIMIETIIWCFYWVICLSLGWENFFIAQVPGLCVIIIGVLIYAGILVIPFCRGREREDLGEDIYAGMMGQDLGDRFGGDDGNIGPPREGEENRDVPENELQDRPLNEEGENREEDDVPLINVVGDEEENVRRRAAVGERMDGNDALLINA